MRWNRTRTNELRIDMILTSWKIKVNLSLEYALVLLAKRIRIKYQTEGVVSQCSPILFRATVVFG